MFKSKKNWCPFDNEKNHRIVIKENMSLYLLYILFSAIYDTFLYTNLSHIVLFNFDISSRFRVPQLELRSLDIAEKTYYDSEEVIRSLIYDCYIIGNEEMTIDIDTIKQLSKPEIPNEEIELHKNFEYGGTHKARIKCLLKVNYERVLVASEHSTIKYLLFRKYCEPETIMKYKKHEAGVNSLALSSNGNYFYSASDDCRVIRWNLYEINHFQFTLIFKLYSSKLNPKILTEHKDKVIQVMTLENALFCSCSLDNTINFYNDPQVDEKSPTLVKSFLVKGGNVIAMYHVYNGKIITISVDKKLRFIDYKEFKYLDNKTIEGIECGGYECI